MMVLFIPWLKRQRTKSNHELPRPASRGRGMCLGICAENERDLPAYFFVLFFICFFMRFIFAVPNFL